MSGIKACLDSEPFGDPLADDDQVIVTAVSLARPDIARLYLDDLPQVAEAYELRRLTGHAWEFDKPLETRQAVVRALSLNGQATVSTREMEAFIDVLEREPFGRLSPRMNELLRVADMCFDSPAGVRANLHSALLKFGTSVSAESVGGAPRRQAIPGTLVYVLRRCGTWNHDWQPPPPLPPPDAWKAWPPWKRHVNEMRRQAIQSVPSRNRSRAEAFRGSLEDGIHIRQTIRGLHRFPEMVYVRKSLRSHDGAVDGREPVVWLLRDAEGELQAGEIWFGLVARWDKRFVGAEFFRTGAAQPMDSTSSIDLHRLVGLISYCDIGLEIESVQATLGPAFDRCVPRSLPTVQLDLALPWWQALAARASQFADRHVVRVAMPTFSKVEEFDAKVREAGKRIVVVSPSAFDQAHLGKLGEMYWVSRPSSPPAGSDTNKVAYEADVKLKYSTQLSDDLTANDWRR